MSKKLVIRINNLQDIEKSDDYDVTEETEIRWDRVIAASSIGLLLFVLLMVGVWYLFNAEKTVNETPPFEAVLDSEAEGVDSQLMAQQKAELTSGVEPKAEGTGSVVGANANPSVQKVDPKAARVNDENSTTVAASPDVKPVIKAAHVTVSNALVDDAPSKPEPVVVPDPAAAPKAETQPKSIVFIDPVEIKSERIVKAQLTHTVNKNEPVERLGDAISMNGDKLIKIYLFTGLEGLKGETLYHDWYLSGKKMARVKMNVRSNKTSASSSKFIDQYMTGDWRVKVSTSRGEELVSANFNVTR